jgi:hypothetical protein
MHGDRYVGVVREATPEKTTVAFGPAGAYLEWFDQTRLSLLRRAQLGEFGQGERVQVFKSGDVDDGTLGVVVEADSAGYRVRLDHRIYRFFPPAELRWSDEPPPSVEEEPKVSRPTLPKEVEQEVRMLGLLRWLDVHDDAKRTMTYADVARAVADAAKIFVEEDGRA